LVTIPALLRSSFTVPPAATVMVPPALLVMPPTVAINCPPLATVIAPLFGEQSLQGIGTGTADRQRGRRCVGKVLLLASVPVTLNMPALLAMAPFTGRKR